MDLYLYLYLYYIYLSTLIDVYLFISHIYIYNQSIYLSVRVGGVLQYAISRDEDHPLPYPAW